MQLVERLSASFRVSHFLLRLSFSPPLLSARPAFPPARAML